MHYVLGRSLVVKVYSAFIIYSQNVNPPIPSPLPIRKYIYFRKVLLSLTFDMSVLNDTMDNSEKKMTAVESERLDRMEDQLDKVETKVDEVLDALKGDNLGMSKGLIVALRDMDTRLIRVESLWNKLMWASMGAGIAAGLSLDKLIEWIQKAS